MPDLLHRAQALQRNRSGHRLDVCLAQVTDPFGQYIARQDGVNSDLESCQLNGATVEALRGRGSTVIKQTRAPSWAKTPAMPLPMPLVPPVTITDLFLIDVSTESSLFIRSASVSEGLFLGSQLTRL